MYNALVQNNLVHSGSQDSLECSLLNMGLNPEDFRWTRVADDYMARVKLTSEDKVNELLTKYGQAVGLLKENETVDVLKSTRKDVANRLDGRETLSDINRGNLQYDLQVSGLAGEFRVAKVVDTYVATMKPLSGRKIKRFVAANQ
jgi:hypothetical protein